MPLQILTAEAIHAIDSLVQIGDWEKPAGKVIVHAVSLRSSADSRFGQAWAYFKGPKEKYYIPIADGNKIVPNLFVGTLWRGPFEWPKGWTLLVGCITNVAALTYYALVIYEVVPLEKKPVWGQP